MIPWGVFAFFCSLHVLPAPGLANTTSSWPIRACELNGCIGGLMDPTRPGSGISLAALSCRRSLYPRKTPWGTAPHSKRGLCSAWARLAWSSSRDSPSTWCYWGPWTRPKWERFSLPDQNGVNARVGFIAHLGFFLKHFPVKIFSSPQIVQERLICQAIVGSQSTNEQIMSVDITCRFVATMLSISPKELNFYMSKVGRKITRNFLSFNINFPPSKKPSLSALQLWALVELYKQASYAFWGICLRLAGLAWSLTTSHLHSNVNFIHSFKMSFSFSNKLCCRPKGSVWLPYMKNWPWQTCPLGRCPSSSSWRSHSLSVRPPGSEVQSLNRHRTLFYSLSHFVFFFPFWVL